MKEGNKKKHLTKEERFCIEKMLKQKKSLNNIALVLERGKSTISEEINRNGGKESYSARKANHRACLRQYRKKRKCNKVAMDRFLTKYVEEKLRLLWSPERISGRLDKKYNIIASPKSIRKFIDRRPSLERFLFWNRVHKKSGRKPSKWMEITDRRFITERPPLKGYGNWEGDFIVCSYTKYVLLVLVEIKTKTTYIRLLPNRKNDLVNQAILSMLSNDVVQTLTLDNDIAFQKHKQLESMLLAPIYFTKPYCSTDKALVENTNRWIRQFVLRKKNLATLTNLEIEEIEYWFNHTPRQCLNFQTPLEAMLDCHLPLTSPFVFGGR
jgi:IS30 family transposase